jgi:hemerythrin-like domain-containing protein
MLGRTRRPDVMPGEARVRPVRARVRSMEASPEPLAGLVREHRLIEATVAETLARLSAAVTAPDDGALTDAALEQLWLFQLLLERDVALHILKEEAVLFPTLRAELARVGPLIDHMIDEHDEIKARRDLLGRTLATLDDDHEAVHRLEEQLRAEIWSARASPAAASGKMGALLDMVTQLDWVFQGHFTGEEDGLFLPAEDLLSAETFERMAREMARLEAEAKP